MKINLIKVGQNLEVDFEKIKKKSSKSKIWQVLEIQEIKNPAFKQNSPYVEIGDLDFINLSGKADFWVAIIDKPFSNNYFSIPIIEKKLILISVYDMESLKILDGISSEKFIMRFIYAFATIFKAYDDRLPSVNEVNNDRLMQPNTSGCLFDFCQNKKDIKKFFKAPKLSIEAETVLNQKQLPADFITQLKKEIQLLKPDFISKMKALIANNILFSTIISFILGLISNIISNLITK